MKSENKEYSKMTIAKVIGFDHVSNGRPVESKSPVYHIFDKSIILGIINEHLYNQGYDSVLLFSNNRFFLYEKNSDCYDFSTRKVIDHPLANELRGAKFF